MSTATDTLFEIRQNLILASEGLESIGISMACGAEDEREGLAHAVTVLARYGLDQCTRLEHMEVELRRQGD
ncbi:MAG TPA: hypothetical protein DCP75_08140 [Haliea salexigens]|uniref:Uncharacterized protein n=1 Tax=Haliea salexigens TaxID=287487 RepID=A0A3C1KLZ7_9GAMM|nr:hypothetical protein [Haliea sp.]HAN27675.1 hypothetical protein [Haliea salexigens]|tara:strand:- start:407 stop:619 length:213 start_codon:yes stop_codon:yes gene_type:complete